MQNQEEDEVEDVGADEEEDEPCHARPSKTSPKASHHKPHKPPQPTSPISVSSEEGGRPAGKGGRGEERKRKREHLPVSFHQLWSHLKELGWKYCQGRGLIDSYVPPLQTPAQAQEPPSV